MATREKVLELGGWQTMLVNEAFSIHKAYLRLKADHGRVPWRRVIKNNKASPRNIFILWLAAHQRLATADRVLKWNVQCNPMCRLCNSENESIEHLFFDCHYTNTVWCHTLRAINIHRRGLGFSQEIQEVYRKAHSNTRRARIYVMLFTEVVYLLWIQRNKKVFNNMLQHPERVCKDIIFRVAARCKEEDRMLTDREIITWERLTERIQGQRIPIIVKCIFTFLDESSDSSESSSEMGDANE
ncbi:uncharacterized protein LOC104888919 [Beta vulgaris subsp. vulgaris]|uniref:uncharacterized protein LOC104888919 n=1 Tax=Beta vulgaris subsp. vulgaris TaxID=3555 RepID=UPI0020371A3B|nr:uncharacterized protein LOC104888919 [Beta vulgaris subsp. vulgaris]